MSTPPPDANLCRRFLVRLTAQPADAGKRNDYFWLKKENPEIFLWGNEHGMFSMVIEGKSSDNTLHSTQLRVYHDQLEAIYELSPARLPRRCYLFDRWELRVYLDKWDGLAILSIELNTPDEQIPTMPDGIEYVEDISWREDFEASDLAFMSEMDAKEKLCRIYSR